MIHDTLTQKLEKCWTGDHEDLSNCEIIFVNFWMKSKRYKKLFNINKLDILGTRGSQLIDG